MVAVPSLDLAAFLVKAITVMFCMPTAIANPCGKH